MRAGAVMVAPWPDALVVLYRETYRRHVQLVYAIVGSRAEAEELVQDAFIDLSQRWDTVQRPAAYLRRSVVSRSIDLLRRRATAELRVPDPAPPDQPSCLVELRDALLGLPERQRAAVGLRYIEGLDDRAIAEALGCRRSTVRSLVARGLAALRLEVPK